MHHQENTDMFSSSDKSITMDHSGSSDVPESLPFAEKLTYELDKHWRESDQS